MKKKESAGDTMNSPVLELLLNGDWGEWQPIRDRLKAWSMWTDLVKTFRELKREELFRSPVHGEGHIERVILLGAVCAMERGLPERDVQLLLFACSYHDTGRLSDWLDVAHGRRSAYKVGRITGLTGDELTMVMAAVEAHSRRDADMDGILDSYGPRDPERYRQLALLLKDADGLDRVRLSDLDVSYLRTPQAVQLADFARWLFDACTEEMKKMGMETPGRPDYYDRELVTRVRDRVNEALQTGRSIMETVTGCLTELFGCQPPEGWMSHPCGETWSRELCCAWEGASCFVMDYVLQKNGDPGTAAADFRKRFLDQYRSDRCADLRTCGFGKDDPVWLCAPFILDVILFTYYFLTRDVSFDEPSVP